MSKTRCALVILRDGEFGSEVCSLSCMGNKVQAGRVEISATKAMPKVGGNPGADGGCLRVTRRDLRPLGWNGAGNPAHTLKVT